jgi:hypothetical protein
MKYEQPPSISRQEMEAAFCGGDGQAVRDALISAFYSEPGRWLARWSVKVADHEDWQARYRAAIVLGNLAVVKRSELDLMKCLATVEKLAADTQKEVRQAASVSLGCLQNAIRKDGVS